MPYIGKPPGYKVAGLGEKDTFTGNGSTVAFDLTSVATSENDIAVFVDNVRQEPGSGKAFTLGNDGSGDKKRITFSAAPANSAEIYVLNNLQTNLISTVSANGITSTEIAANAVGASELANDAVDTAAVADDAITSAKLADDAVVTAAIADDAVTAALLADNAVATAAIADNAVTLAKIADGTQGGTLFFGASGAPTELAAGTSGYFLKTQGSGANPTWAEVPAGAPTGAGSEKVFFENENSVDANYTITTNFNAVSAGPVTVASGVTVTIPAGQAWVIV